MSRQSGEQERVRFQFIKKYLANKIFFGVLIAAALAAVAFGVGKSVSSDAKTTKIGFENLGELATQAAYCTEVNVTEASRDLFGVTIPFTRSKYVYSYDVVIKAGFDFGKIEWSVNETTIEVKLPEIRILSSELDMDSFKLYHEEESIFRPITLAENNDAMANLIQSAEENAKANGLLDNALTNAKTILTGFFANAYDLKKYEIKFTVQ